MLHLRMLFAYTVVLNALIPMYIVLLFITTAQVTANTERAPVRTLHTVVNYYMIESITCTWVHCQHDCALLQNEVVHPGIHARPQEPSFCNKLP